MSISADVEARTHISPKQVFYILSASVVVKSGVDFNSLDRRQKVKMGHYFFGQANSKNENHKVVSVHEELSHQ